MLRGFKNTLLVIAFDIEGYNNVYVQRGQAEMYLFCDVGVGV